MYSKPKDNAKLSSRELEIVCLVADGLSAKQIASQLGLSSLTIHKHKQRIMRKMQVKTSVELVLYAERKGWLM